MPCRIGKVGTCARPRTQRHYVSRRSILYIPISHRGLSNHTCKLREQLRRRCYALQNRERSMSCRAAIEVRTMCPAAACRTWSTTKTSRLPNRADICADTSEAAAGDTAVSCRTGRVDMRCRAVTAARIMCSAAACLTRSTTRAAPCRIPATPAHSAAW